APAGAGIPGGPISVIVSPGIRMSAASARWARASRRRPPRMIVVNGSSSRSATTSDALATLTWPPRPTDRPSAVAGTIAWPRSNRQAARGLAGLLRPPCLPRLRGPGELARHHDRGSLLPLKHLVL